MQLKNLDKTAAKRLINFLETRIAPRDDPRSVGAPLSGVTLGNFWKYRVGDYRIIADIQDHKLTVLVLQADHRRKIYRIR